MIAKYILESENIEEHLAMEMYKPIEVKPDLKVIENKNLKDLVYTELEEPEEIDEDEIEIYGELI